MKRAQLPVIATVLSMLACYGTLLGVTVLGAMGVTVALNDGLWAVGIVIFAALAVAGLIFSRRRHGKILPVALGGVGLCAVTYAMFVEYSRTLEIAGFALLIAAAWIDRRAA